jgi:ElaB/YqjD/DUF883 family membrane-anchored ribosome-binding protein
MTKTQDKSKIHEALELLNTAAAEEQSELREMIGGQYHNLKEFVATIAGDVQRGVSGVYNAGKSQVAATASVVDNHVRANRWAYIGGSVAVGLLVGFLLARGRK